MCGIVGYIGPKDAAPILLNGIKRLEYRGYDSAGLAYFVNGKISVTKESGKISKLETKIHDIDIKSTIGIGHTRWATHGAPTSVNAHPHIDCNGNIALFLGNIAILKIFCGFLSLLNSCL